jgi:kinesin family protein C1
MLDRFAIHPLKRSKSRVNHRDTSICEAMTRLMVDEEGENCDSHEHQASSLFNKPALRKLAFKHSVNGSLRSSKNNNGEKGVVLHSNLGDLVAPKTPSQVKVPSKLEALNITPATPCKSSKQSFQKTPFLTKDSNVPAFIAWDVDDRLEHMESMYSKFEETIKSTTLDRNGLEEAITAYKARSKNSGLSMVAL